MSTNLGDTTCGVKRFSVSKSTSKEARFHHTFETRDGLFVSAISCAMHDAWSPIVWKNGKRLKCNFESCGIVALDIDDGFPLDDAKRWLKDLCYRSAILTTKSHQKQKGNVGPCDRFRILIDAELCTDGAQYEQNMKWWHRKLPMADASCSDGGRLFFASPKLECTVDGTNIYRWQDFSKEIERQKKALEDYRIKQKKDFKSAGSIGERLRHKILVGAPEGLRHKTCYAIGATLTELGIGYDEAVQIICAGPLVNIGVHDIQDAVKKARKKVLGG